MRKALIALATAVLLALATALPTVAHQDPCGETTPAPGHSAYALHHIAPFAKTHIIPFEHLPGDHMGYAGLCGVLAP